MSRRAAGWLGLALFASLLANVFLGSVLVARLLMPGDHQHGNRARYSYTQAWQKMAETLPEPHRAEAVALWQQVRERRGQGRAGWSQAREAVYRALLKEPFDEAALRAAFAKAREASSERWTAYQAAILATASHLPLAQRKAYVEEQERRHAAREKRRAER